MHQEERFKFCLDTRNKGALQEERFKFCLDTRNKGALATLDPAYTECLSIQSSADLPYSLFTHNWNFLAFFLSLSLSLSLFKVSVTKEKFSNQMSGEARP